MSRLPPLRREDLDKQGQEVWDSIAGTKGTEVTDADGGIVGAMASDRATEVTDADGGLIGPFNAFVHAPGPGRHSIALGAELLFGSSIEPRLVELAIVTVGSHWKSEFEWWAHRPAAARNGIADAVLDAVAEGRSPEFDRDDERLVHAVASQLVTSGRVDEATYAGARGLLGDAGMVELISLCGYYTTISFILNAFDVGLPPGQTQVWQHG